MWIATAKQVRQAEKTSNDDFGITPEALMERAGTAIANHIQKSQHQQSKITILCGKGNNGADGLVAARHLHQKGHIVHCVILASPPDLAPLGQKHLKSAQELNIPLTFLTTSLDPNSLPNQDLIIDSILGTGSSGPLTGLLAQVVTATNESNVPILAVDVPTGIDPDTGQTTGLAVRATTTLTLGFPKPFLFQSQGLEHAGQWKILDIGFPSQVLDQPTGARLVTANQLRPTLPTRTKNSHKGSNGSVLIVAGSPQMPGAAVLATRAALRAGAGLVTLAAPDSVCQILARHCPEAILLPLSKNAAQTLLDQQSKHDAALFGPGLTQSPTIRELLGEIWPHWTIPCCIDADALNLIASGLPLPQGSAVLTPHPGEMARILQTTTESIQTNRFESATQAANQTQKTVILKGAYSVSATPGHPLQVNPTGNPGMAAGGMGDILAGIVANLLAQGLSPHNAATLATYWHGLAGDLAAKQIGSVGFTATEVANLLPKARDLILEQEAPNH